MFGNYLLIDTGKILFIFDVKENYKLPEETYNEFKNDEFFKEKFLNSTALYKEDGDFSNKLKVFLNTPKEKAAKIYTEDELLEIENIMLLWEITRRFGEHKVKEYYLAKPENRILMEKHLSGLKIDFNLENINKVISFTKKI